MSRIRITLSNVGPIKEADVRFGDLTVLVGPQATGKSIFLQIFKLLKDRAHVHDTFGHHNVLFNGKPAAFLDGFFGRGMAGIWSDRSSLRMSGKPVALPDLAKPARSRAREETVFFIPAQRVVSLRSGATQNFGQFEYGDPYVLRAFSDTVHRLLQNEFGAKGEIFPQSNRLNETLRKPIAEHLFGESRLSADTSGFTKRLVLNVPGQDTGLPYLAWSAGQREFTPLLLGLYWLCPAGARSRREPIEWVVIEELEMGLHPLGISTVLLLVLELLRRGYKVVVSTHSPVVLEMIWAIQVFKRLNGAEADVRTLFDLPASQHAKELGKSAIEKDYRVYYFGRDGKVADISALDPSADTIAESDWGGLSGFASHAGEVVASVVNRNALSPKKAAPAKATAKAGSE